MLGINTLGNKWMSQTVATMFSVSAIKGGVAFGPSTNGQYTYYTFNSSGTITFANPTNLGLQILCVGGGGGGGGGVTGNSTTSW